MVTFVAEKNYRSAFNEMCQDTSGRWWWCATRKDRRNSPWREL